MPQKRFQPPLVKDLKTKSALSEVSEVFDNLTPLSNYPVRSDATLTVGANSLTRSAPKPAGQELIIPEADSSNFSQSITILKEGAAGQLRIRAAAGTINGATDLVIPAPSRGLIRMISNGSGMWLETNWFKGAGLLRAPQVLTSGTSITHPVGTRFIKIRGVGGGAGGGGSAAVAYTGGGCGGAGTYAEKTFAASSLTSTYTIGAAGVGVADAEGTDGGDSTFTHGGVTVTAPGGNNSASRITAAAGTADVGSGGPGGGPATNADVSVPGQNGGSLIRDANSPPIMRFYDAPGGSTPLGSGGKPATITPGSTTNSGGTDAEGFGAGGGGRCNGSSTTATAGGNGSPGVWIVEEYG